VSSSTPRENRRAFGNEAERLAESFLRAQGVRIVARNVHLRHAEIDLVALDGAALCIVEVRARRGDRFGSAAESVDLRKRARLARAAGELLATRPLPRHARVRFDVIAIDARLQPPTLEWIRDAFYAS
jgi:putative endonuclease